MGTTCAPEKRTERPVQDTDADTVKQAAAQSGEDKSKDEAHLIDILNSYTAKNEALEKENAELKKGNDGETSKLMKELEAMKAMLAQKEQQMKEKDEKIKEEENRIAMLKLQSELREAEARLLKDSQKATTLIEGKLLKFTKAGKGKPSLKLVEIMERPGEVVENGYSPGQLIVSWADDEKSSEVSRARVTKLYEGSENVRGTEYANRTFSLETTPNKKVIAFACDSEDEKNKWFSTISGALERFVKETKDMNSDYTFSIEFTEKPLGFRVEERFVMDENNKKVEILMVTKIQDTHEHLKTKGLVEGLNVVACNDTDFWPLTYPEKLEIIKGAEYPFKLTFTGKKFLKAGGGEKGSHARDVSMQILYPEVFAALTTEGSDAREELYNHPLVKQNPEIKKWLDRDDFKEHFQELMSDPDKLRDFLMNKQL